MIGRQAVAEPPTTDFDVTPELNGRNDLLDTNLLENSVRPTKLGAKNWLFIGHTDFDGRSITYSLVVSWGRQGIDPLA